MSKKVGRDNVQMFCYGLLIPKGYSFWNCTFFKVKIKTFIYAYTGDEDISNWPLVAGMHSGNYRHVIFQQRPKIEASSRFSLEESNLSIIKLEIIMLITVIIHHLCINIVEFKAKEPWWNGMDLISTRKCNDSYFNIAYLYWHGRHRVFYFESSSR